MRRVAVALAAIALVLVGVERPAAAAGGTVVSGVAVFSPVLYVGLEPFPSQWPYKSITMTETRQGLFVAGTQAEVATLACTFTGGAWENYAIGSGTLSGSCTGSSITGVQVSKSCGLSYFRAGQWLSVTEVCELQVGSSSTTVTRWTTHVAHLPPPPTDRYYYTGVAIEFPATLPPPP